jgi:phosphoribosyl-AMP cyclohydrolase
MTMPPLESNSLDSLKYDSAGLIPAIVQDHATGEVLMMAWMNRESLASTIETRFTHFWSRSRKQFWKKGETSGHTQRVLSIRADCDRDVLLIGVEQIGAACHDGYRSCFYSDMDLEERDWKTIGEPLVDPATVYKK